MLKSQYLYILLLTKVHSLFTFIIRCVLPYCPFPFLDLTQKTRHSVTLGSSWWLSVSLPLLLTLFRYFVRRFHTDICFCFAHEKNEL
jgi:hypothetical protein